MPSRPRCACRSHTSDCCATSDASSELEAVVRAFPDYRWDRQHLFVDGVWPAAHLVDTGTHRGTFLDVPATRRTVSTQEFAGYRVERVNGVRIVEVRVTADNPHLLQQLR
jgi:predicted ester cyclase